MQTIVGVFVVLFLLAAGGVYLLVKDLSDADLARFYGAAFGSAASAAVAVMREIGHGIIWPT